MKLNIKRDFKDEINDYFFKQTRTIDEQLVWCSENNCSDLWVVVGKHSYISKYGKVYKLPCVPTTKDMWMTWYSLYVLNELNETYVRNKNLDLSVKVRMPESCKDFGKYDENYYRYRCALSYSEEKSMAAFRMIKPYNIYFDNLNYPKESREVIEKSLVMDNKLIVLNGATGSGKALHEDTEIPTPSGFKLMKDLKIGDIIYDGAGNETVVEDKYLSIREKHYTFVFNDGTLINSCDNHLWEVCLLNDYIKRGVNQTSVLTTQEMVDIGLRNKKGRLNFAITKEHYIDSNENVNLSIHPYWLGSWLGDGYSDRAVICNSDVEQTERLNKYHNHSNIFEKCGKDGRKFFYRYYAELKEELRKLNLLKNKHIPLNYVNSSRKNKIFLIEGLMDTDGYVDKNGICRIDMTNESIVNSVRDIICSLGWTVNSIRIRFPRCNGKICKNCYRLSFVPSKELKLSVTHKKERLDSRFSRFISQQSRHSRKYIIDIYEENKKGNYYCIRVSSPLHTFLCTRSYIKTHNSTTLSATINTFSKSLMNNSTLITLEDPIENRFVASDTFNVIQQELNVDFRDFASGVKTALRQHPNYVLIGEMRDKEVITSCIEAVRGGHGVFSTFHAPDVAGTISRLMYHLENDMNLGYDLITNLGLIVSQRMIKSDSGYIVDTQHLLFNDEVTKAILEIIFSGKDTNIAMEVGKLMDREDFIKKGYVKNWSY